ncbi:MAG: hypothetical protein ABIL70_03415 [candidate division WOR-3 bacterium]
MNGRNEEKKDAGVAGSLRLQYHPPLCLADSQEMADSFGVGNLFPYCFRVNPCRHPCLSVVFALQKQEV